MADFYELRNRGVVLVPFSCILCISSSQNIPGLRVCELELPPTWASLHSQARDRCIKLYCNAVR